MSVKTIMTATVVTVELDDKLALVNEIFKHRKFHHLLAVEDGELMGIVSDRDLFKALSPNVGTINENEKDAATLNKRVHQVMSRHPHVLSEDATILDALELFNTQTISCIPIVNNKNRPVGIISWRDLLRHFAKLHAPAEPTPA
jgi:acetoin utilization protein AcuB